MILNQIEKIEVSIRAIIAYECSNELGVFWLSEKDNFKIFKEYTSCINAIFNEINRSKELFLQEYKNNYTEELPPSWITLEVCSFGSLSRIYSNLNSGLNKRKIADKFGLNEKVFETWIHSMVYIRNVCAHHSRLWNKRIKIKVELPKKTTGPWINNFNIIDDRDGSSRNIKDRTYFSICMIKYLLDQINPNNTFKEKLSELYIKYPNVDLSALGYTKNWVSEDLWK
ncbi:Abortive infection bacteriophage resistance protein [Maribacter ulvicola]|uniref:Abortive infection bacteriophage resistance protein n=1 Tax=Maribacter ulvicola TaxID=228959 RepID=A0A1N6Q0N0_9FLAO|nr:Abortive infection bacteriophage resistance protein [Maribacter ulvicola]